MFVKIDHIRGFIAKARGEHVDLYLALCERVCDQMRAGVNRVKEPADANVLLTKEEPIERDAGIVGGLRGDKPRECLVIVEQAKIALRYNRHCAEVFVEEAALWRFRSGERLELMIGCIGDVMVDQICNPCAGFGRLKSPDYVERAVVVLPEQARAIDDVIDAFREDEVVAKLGEHLLIVRMHTAKHIVVEALCQLRTRSPGHAAHSVGNQQRVHASAE